MEHFVIDTDPGVDDAHAIMMALAHPRACVEAITTVDWFDRSNQPHNANIVLEVDHERFIQLMDMGIQ